MLGLFLNAPLFSELPTAAEIAGQMTIGWNIGNSLEVPTGETGWGNPRVDQELIDAVRATGGNNGSRVLVVQGPSTDIDKTNRLMTSMPADQIEGRLMVEIHYYTPWNFCGMDKDETWGKIAYFWGKNFHSTTNPSRNATWGEENIVESYFQMMKTKFVDKGIPVIMGEYSALKRTSLTGADLDLHIASREYFYQYVTESAKRHGLMPVYWDNGYSGNNGLALFNRNNGAIVDPGALNALMAGASASTSVEKHRKSEMQSTLESVHALSAPGSSSTEIQLYLKEAAQLNIAVFNVLGQAVARFNELNFGSGPLNVSLRIGGWSPGTYIIHVNAGGHRLTRKFLLLH